MRFAIAIICIVLGNVYMIGMLIWMIHLGRQFDRYIKLCQEQEVPFALAADIETKKRVLERKKLLLKAATLAHLDYKRIPLWPKRLRGRWNVDYLALAEAEKRGLEL